MAKQNKPIPDQQIARDWLAITIRKFRGNIRKVKAVDTEHLLRSFGGQVSAGPRVRLEYDERGMFVDMGVGRGMPIGSARVLGKEKFSKYRDEFGRLHRHLRKPKKWYNREITHQTKRLAEIISAQKGEIFIAKLSDVLPFGPKGAVNINFEKGKKG